MTDFPPEIKRLGSNPNIILPREILDKINELIDGYSLIREKLSFMRAKLEGQDEKFENHTHVISVGDGEAITSGPWDVNG